MRDIRNRRKTLKTAVSGDLNYSLSFSKLSHGQLCCDFFYNLFDGQKAGFKQSRLNVVVYSMTKLIIVIISLAKEDGYTTSEHR